MSGINNSCIYDYRYSKSFDSCLFLHGEPLQLILLICTISIVILLIFLSVMLIIAKKLLSKLMKEKSGTVHSFMSQSTAIQNHDSQESTKSNANFNVKSQHLLNNDQSQQQSE